MVRLSSGLSAALLAGSSVILLASPAQANHGINCDDFDSRSQAQAYYDRDTSDPEGLDRDNDGLACETFVYPPVDDRDVNTPDTDTDRTAGGSSTGTPSGGVEAGAGGTATAAAATSPGMPGAPAAAVAGGALLIAAGAGLARRPKHAGRHTS